MNQLDRRDFLRLSGGAAGLALAAGTPLLDPLQVFADEKAKKNYDGPRVIIVRFGGGVRRQETIEADNTYCPYFLKQMAPRGTLFTNMEISHLNGVETSHGQGTLYTITGKYDKYEDIENKFLAERFESKVPTIFEQLRKTFDIPSHESLIINGEDRTDEEFYAFSNHHLFGPTYRSEVLSLYRFKIYLLERLLEADTLSDQERAEKTDELKKLRAIDPRSSIDSGPEIENFWRRWREHYGDSGLRSARGDALLTDLALRAMAELSPKLMMIHYQDPDYVHWGNASHYTRGIVAIDHGIERLVAAAESYEDYKGRTVFVVVPDCGRDTNKFLKVPFQHHFGTRSSHEIFALVLGPGIARGQVIDRVVDQVDIAPTVGHLMGFKTEHAEGSVLEEAIA